MNKNIYTNIYDDNYKGRYYGWLSFSFKFKYVELLVDYFNKSEKQS